MFVFISAPFLFNIGKPKYAEEIFFPIRIFNLISLPKFSTKRSETKHVSGTAKLTNMCNI
jgi:hypothetical protein